jgi:hypothetical protein
MPQTPMKTTTKVVNSMKRVREEMLRWEWDAAVKTINSGTEVELYEFNGTPGDQHEIRIGECEELLSLGIEPAFDAGGPTNYYLEQLRVFDRDGSEWNKFLTIPALTRMNANQLPFNSSMNFERMMMSWGFKSFLSSPDALASTLKLPEGDRLRLGITANSAGDIVTGNNRTFGVVRRYLPGSDVDYRHFNEYDGGLKSNKRYYNDVQYLATTIANQWVQAWRLQIIRNEAYKFFQGGILPDVNLASAAMASHLAQAKVMIDDPLTEYNKYFVNHNYNSLPFNNSNHTYSDGSVATPWAWQIERMHRFSPTVDILKNRNKDLTMYVMDDGTLATDVYTAMIGIKYQL